MGVEAHHTFDYIIVGAGSAGCVLAEHRLKRAGSLNRAFAGIPLVVNALRYLASRSGVLATGSYDVGGNLCCRG